MWRTVSGVTGVALIAIGASVPAFAREGWYPVGGILFIIGVVIVFVLIGDWIRARRPSVD